jgi:hypothetical protein
MFTTGGTYPWSFVTQIMSRQWHSWYIFNLFKEPLAINSMAYLVKIWCLKYKKSITFDPVSVLSFLLGNHQARHMCYLGYFWYWYFTAVFASIFVCAVFIWSLYNCWFLCSVIYHDFCWLYKVLKTY